jgi:hypothetical protein
VLANYFDNNLGLFHLHLVENRQILLPLAALIGPIAGLKKHVVRVRGGAHVRMLHLLQNLQRL